MSDHVQLALWFPTQTRAQVLPHLLGTAELLPQESLERGVQACAVTALDWSEPPVLEERFSEGLPLAEAANHLREFMNDDTACELEMAWLLWTYAGGWKQQPQPVRLTGMGSSFGDAAARREGHVVVDFGLDENFLAELAPWNTETRRCLQANILLLLAYARKIERELRPVRRWMGAENGADWTQKLVARLEAAGTLMPSDGLPIQ